MKAYNKRDLLRIAYRAGAATTMVGLAVATDGLVAPQVASAAESVFKGVRKGSWKDRCGQDHLYVEFEPNMWAVSWRTEGPGSPSFWGDPGRRAYRVLRAYYSPRADPLSIVRPASDWSLVGSDVSATIPGDVNRDGTVDIFDYNLVIANYGKTGCGVQGDANGDCKVNGFDYSAVVANFGKTFEVQRWESDVCGR